MIRTARLYWAACDGCGDTIDMDGEECAKDPAVALAIARAEGGWLTVDEVALCLDCLNLPEDWDDVLDAAGRDTP
jgi:hypothetical protein